MNTTPGMREGGGGCCGDTEVDVKKEEMVTKCRRVFLVKPSLRTMKELSKLKWQMQ